MYLVEFMEEEKRTINGKEYIKQFFGGILEALNCSHCGDIKGIGDFVKRSDRSHGVGHICKACMIDRNRCYELTPEQKVKRQINALNYSKTFRGRISQALNGANLRAKNYKQPYRVEREDVLRRYELQAGKCVYCLEHFDEYGKNGLSLEHITPFNMGGVNKIDNVVFACMPCNQKKADRTLYDWLTETFKPSHVTDVYINLGRIGIDTLKAG